MEKPIITDDIVETICEGDEVEYYGEYYNKEGVFPLGLFAGKEADTIRTLYLHVNPKYHIILTDTLVSGDTYHWEGDEYSKEGIYMKNFQSSLNCDSIQELHLIENTILLLTPLQSGEYCAESGMIEVELPITGKVEELSVTVSSTAYNERFYDTILPMPINNILQIPYNNIRAGRYEINIDALFRDKIVLSANTTMTFRYPASVIEQKWNDVLIVLTNQYNGGYDFVEFQWYKDGERLEGETHSYLNQELSPLAEYSVLLTESNGTQLLSCPVTPIVKSSVDIYPTIIKKRQKVYCNVCGQAQYTLYNTCGQILSMSQPLHEGLNSITLPDVNGLYIISVTMSETNETKIAKIVVQ